MPAAAVIPAGAGLIGSFMQSNASKNAANSNQSNLNNIDSQIEQIANRLWGTFQGLSSATNPAGSLQQAKNFYSSEVTGGLDPAVIGSANANFAQNNARNLATLENQLGPNTPNMAGMIRDFGNNEIMGNVSLQDQLAAQNQQVRQQGAQGLTSVADSVLQFGENAGNSALGAFSGLGSQFLGASEYNASNAWANNPFSAIANLPWAQILGGGGTPGGAGIPASQYPTSGPQYSGQPEPGQGGLGALGGLG